MTTWAYSLKNTTVDPQICPSTIRNKNFISRLKIPVCHPLYTNPTLQRLPQRKVKQELNNQIQNYKQIMIITRNRVIRSNQIYKVSTMRWITGELRDWPFHPNIHQRLRHIATNLRAWTQIGPHKEFIERSHRWVWLIPYLDFRNQPQATKLCIRLELWCNRGIDVVQKAQADDQKPEIIPHPTSLPLAVEGKTPDPPCRSRWLQNK